MKKVLLILSLNILLPLIMLVVFPSILIRIRQGISSTSNAKLISFVKNKPISFSFISNLPNLYSLSLDMKNPSILNNSRIDLDITGPSSQRSVVFYGANIGDPSTVPLKFSPFSDPPNTNYLVTLSTDNENNNGLYVITDSQGQVVFRSYYLKSNFYQNIIDNFKRQIELFSQRSPWHNFFYLFFIILVNLLIIFK